MFEIRDTLKPVETVSEPSDWQNHWSRGAGTGLAGLRHLTARPRELDRYVKTLC